MYFNFWVGVCRRGGGLMGLLEVRCSLSSRKMMLDGDIVCREGGWVTHPVAAQPIIMHDYVI
jgi:hypothetical protein